MMRGRAGWLMALGMALCLCLGLVLSAETLGAPSARAAGWGPCSPLTPHDLAQPQVTAQGNATAALSQSQGTEGTLLSLSGSGWPANTTVQVSVWADLSGQFIGAPLRVRTQGADLAPIQATTDANGSLSIPSFPMAGECYAMSDNGAPLSSVQLVVVAHTLDGQYTMGTVRRPLIFTYLAMPWMRDALSAIDGNMDTHAGDARTVLGAGFSPGARVTVTTRMSQWPDETAWWGPPNQAVAASVAPLAVTASNAGAVSFTYTIPQAPPLTFVGMQFHVIDARLGDVTLVASTTYTITPAHLPAIQIDHATVAPGEFVMVRGSNWQPGQQGVIEYCRGLGDEVAGGQYCDPYTTQAIGSFTVDSAGRFWARARLPANARPGHVTLQARVGNADIQTQALVGQWLAVSTPLTIAEPPVTWTQIHPRQALLFILAPYAIGALALLAALVRLAIYLRRRRNSPETGETT